MGNRKSLPKTAIPRIYFIDREIASGKYPNAPGLAKKYETSQSSINRDIAYMRDMLNAPIEYDFFKKGFYYTEKTYRLCAAYATEDDLLALGMAKSLMDLYKNTPLYDTALSLLENISAPLQEEKNADWFLDRIVIPKTASSPADPKAWNVIVSGLRENKIITFQYLSANKEKLNNQGKSPAPKTTFRRVRPYQLLFDRNNWYLFAFDEDKKETRIFALSRMANVVLTEDAFTIPRGFDYRSLEGTSYFGIYAGAKTYKFVILITGDTRWIKERVWADDQKIKETRGGLELSFTSNQYEKVLEWLFSQSPFARPLAPKNLVEQWSAIIKEMAKSIENVR
jgi:predicted DNA-binding transcriptional regulator YafY